MNRDENKNNIGHEQRNNNELLTIKYEHYMKIALEEATKAAAIDEVPIGAIVVQNFGEDNEQIVARAYNLKETNQDPAGHAEFIALQKASEKLERWRLSDCTVFVTLEPCIMCAGLMHQARVARCVFAASDPKGGALGSLYAINKDTRLNHNFEAINGILESECSQILKDFFKSKRK